MIACQRWTLGAILVLATTLACAPTENDMDDPSLEPGEISDKPAVLEVNLTEFRGEVEESMGELRTELEALREDIAQESSEEWTELSESAERTTSDVMTELDRLATATAEEARQIQFAASERLAELEGEMARRDVAASDDAESLRSALEKRLTDLEADLEELRRDSMEPGLDNVEQMSQVDALAARAEMLRTESADVGATPGTDIDEKREALGDEIADLTRDVREEWYQVRWKLDAA